MTSQPGSQTPAAPATAALAQPCSTHKVHTPKNLTVEFHHVVPVAWQLATPNPNPPFPGMDPSGRGMLWDARGIWICPTGHRNTHHWIEQLMHAVAKLTATDQTGDPQAAWNSLSAAAQKLAEAPVALEALTRFAPYGSLRGLTTKGEWGQV